jgi:hypothetical protein
MLEIQSAEEEQIDLDIPRYVLQASADCQRNFFLALSDSHE